MVGLKAIQTAGALAGLVLCLAAPGASLAATNLGFESGNVSGWTASGTGAFGATDSLGPFAPFEGLFFGFVEGGEQDVYTTLSRAFDLQAGDEISGEVGFRANDVFEDGGTIFNDDGYLTINGLTLFSRDVAAVGDFGDSGWVHFSFVAPTAGTYLLEIGAANRGDGGFASAVVLDNLFVPTGGGGGVGGIPEPQSWALLLLGFGVLGASLRSRRRLQLQRA